MASPLVDRQTNDTIPASDHNDVKDYIEDGVYRVNTQSLSIGGTQVIDASRNISASGINGSSLSINGVQVVSSTRNITAAAITATDWSDVSITQSQISDLSVTGSTLVGPDYIITLSGATATATNMADGTTTSSGTTHSTVIQTTINHAVSNGRGWIHIKRGTYNINATLTLNAAMRISGDGQEFTELQAVNSLNGNMLVINSTNSATQYRVILEDMKFDGNDTNQTTGSCIVAYGIIQSRFYRLHFENFYNYGIHLWDVGGGSGAYGHHNQIIDCLFDQSDTGLGIGIYMRNNDENAIIACQFQYLKMGIKDETGFNQIEMNSFVNQGTGIQILDSSRTRVINNVFDLLTERGIHLKGAFNNVSNNTFYDNSNGVTGNFSCIYIEWYGSNIISSNTFLTSGYTRSGIREVGNVGAATYGKNLISANMFVEMSGATDLGGTGWTQAPLEETNTNYKFGNISISSTGVVNSSL